jgi:hypothetical protein
MTRFYLYPPQWDERRPTAEGGIPSEKLRREAGDRNLVVSIGDAQRACRPKVTGVSGETNAEPSAPAPLGSTIPDECCGNRCRHCDRWHDPKLEAACGNGLAVTLAKPDDEPPTMWCESCHATTYVDSIGACAACGWEAG